MGSRLGKISAARSQPTWSSSSQALLAKSSVWPSSMKRWSVHAAKRRSATCAGVQAVGDGCAQGPLGGVGAARLGEAAEPVAEDCGAGLGGDQRVEVEVGRPVLRCHVRRGRRRDRVHGARSDGAMNGWRFATAGQDREPGRPSSRAVPHAEARGFFEDAALLSCLVQGDDGLREDERQILLEPEDQLGEPVGADALSPDRRRVHEDACRRGLRPGTSGKSSAKGSNVQPPPSSKRAWCQWQVMMPLAMLPRLIGKPMCGQRLSTA